MLMNQFAERGLLQPEKSIARITFCRDSERKLERVTKKFGLTVSLFALYSMAEMGWGGESFLTQPATGPSCVFRRPYSPYLWKVWGWNGSPFVY